MKRRYTITSALFALLLCLGFVFGPVANAAELPIESINIDLVDMPELAAFVDYTSPMRKDAKTTPAGTTAELTIVWVVSEDGGAVYKPLGRWAHYIAGKSYALICINEETTGTVNDATEYFLNGQKTTLSTVTYEENGVRQSVKCLYNTGVMVLPIVNTHTTHAPTPEVGGIPDQNEPGNNDDCESLILFDRQGNAIGHEILGWEMSSDGVKWELASIEEPFRENTYYRRVSHEGWEYPTSPKFQLAPVGTYYLNGTLYTTAESYVDAYLKWRAENINVPFYLTKKVDVTPSVPDNSVSSEIPKDDPEKTPSTENTNTPETVVSSNSVSDNATTDLGFTTDVSDTPSTTFDSDVIIDVDDTTNLSSDFGERQPTTTKKEEKKSYVLPVLITTGSVLAAGGGTTWFFLFRKKH